jgi:hypothetical protein
MTLGGKEAVSKSKTKKSEKRASGSLERVVRRRKRCFYCSNWARGGKRKGSALCQSCYNNDWGFHP